MNRAERRKLDKKNLTAKDILFIEENSKKQGLQQATSALFASLAMTLHDKWGWGNVRVTRLLKQIDNQFDSINKGYLSIEDMKKVVSEELNIDIE